MYQNVKHMYRGIVFAHQTYFVPFCLFCATIIVMVT